VRRYSFLLTMGFAIYLGYAVYARQVTLRLDDYRGVDTRRGWARLSALLPRCG